MKKGLTLEEKYLAVASEIENSSMFIFTKECEALMVLSSMGEKHAIADVFYLDQENEGKDILNRTNGLGFYPHDFVSNIIKLPVVQKIKQCYLEHPEHLTADEYAIMAGIVADDDEREWMLYYAAKNYLKDFRDYGNALSGAFFLKMIERSAKLNNTKLEDCPVANKIKTFLFCGVAKKKAELFNSLISSVRKGIDKQTKNKNDSASKFARAFAMKNENLKSNEWINKESFEIFRDLADTDTIWSLKITSENIVKREETGNWI